jgi:hypothetical protein
MEWIRSKKTVFVLISLFLVISLYHNQVTNWHFHYTNNGVVVIHSHPYRSNTIPDTPYQKHQHNSFEFLFLSLVFNAIPLILAFLVLGFICRSRLSNFLLLPAVGNMQCGYYRTFLSRGPPDCAF